MQGDISSLVVDAVVLPWHTSAIRRPSGVVAAFWNMAGPRLQAALTEGAPVATARRAALRRPCRRAHKIQMQLCMRQWHTVARAGVGRAGYEGSVGAAFSAPTDGEAASRAHEVVVVCPPSGQVGSLLACGFWGLAGLGRAYAGSRCLLSLVLLLCVYVHAYVCGPMLLLCGVFRCAAAQLRFVCGVYRCAAAH